MCQKDREKISLTLSFDEEKKEVISLSLNGKIYRKYARTSEGVLSQIDSLIARHNIEFDNLNNIRALDGGGISRSSVREQIAKTIQVIKNSKKARTIK